MTTHTEVGHDLSIALRDRSQDVSYGDLRARVNHFALALARKLQESMKVEPPQHILVVMDHSVDSVVALLAAMEVGLAIPATSREVSEGRLDQVFVDIAIGPNRQLELGTGVQCLTYEDLDACASNAERPERRADEPAILVSTSGTTGAGKWVAHSPRSIGAAAALVVDELRLRPDDLSLALMPLNHTHGLVTTLLAPLSSGGTVLLADPYDVGAIRHALTQSVSCVSASPTLHRFLLKVSQLSGGALFAPDRIRNASDVLSPQLLSELVEAYSVPVIDSYALTELPGTIMTRELHGASDLNRPYRAVDQIEYRISNDCESYSGRGELVVDGPHRMCGLYDFDRRRLIEGTTAGGIASGDMVVVSDTGRFELVGRLREMINRGGETLAPARIENLVTRIEGVGGAMAFAENHQLLGEAVSVAITVVPGRDREKVRSEILRSIPNGLQPVTVYVVEALTYKENGKADRSAVRERIFCERGQL